MHCYRGLFRFNNELYGRIWTLRAKDIKVITKCLVQQRREKDRGEREKQGNSKFL